MQEEQVPKCHLFSRIRHSSDLFLRSTESRNCFEVHHGPGVLWVSVSKGGGVEMKKSCFQSTGKQGESANGGMQFCKRWTSYGGRGLSSQKDPLSLKTSADLTFPPPSAQYFQLLIDPHPSWNLARQKPGNSTSLIIVGSLTGGGLLLVGGSQCFCFELNAESTFWSASIGAVCRVLFCTRTAWNFPDFLFSERIYSTHA